MPDETSRPVPVYPSGGSGFVSLIERSILLLLVIGLLIGVAAVLRPFTTAILFGATLAIAAWPLRQAMIGWGLGRGLTATALLLLSIIVVGLPIFFMAPVLAEQVGYMMQRAQSFLAEMPVRPAWLTAIPLAGDRLGRIWDELAKAEGNLSMALAPYSATLREMLITAARALADSVVQVALSLIVATMFWVRGDTLTSELRDIFNRLGGRIAEETLITAAGAVRSVAYGVIGTAVIQAALLTLGLAIAGISGAATLGFVGLLLATSQIGAPLLLLIWGGAAWWLFKMERPAGACLWFSGGSS